jgi:hypothetical protein
MKSPLPVHWTRLAHYLLGTGRKDNLNEVNISDPHGYSLSPKPQKQKHHVCRTCARAFSRLEHLSRHTLSHTKEKPFQCGACSRWFSRRDLVLRHQRKVHVSPIPASGMTDEADVVMNQKTHGRDVQPVIPLPSNAVQACEGNTWADWCDTASSSYHAQTSVSAPPAIHAAGKQPSHSQTVSSPMRLQKDQTDLDFPQQIDQGTNSIMIDSDENLNDLSHQRSYHPAQYLTQGEIASHHHEESSGKSLYGTLRSNAGDLNWMENSHMQMSRPEIDGTYPSALTNITECEYGEGSPGTSTDYNQISREMRQSGLTWQAQTSTFSPVRIPVSQLLKIQQLTQESYLQILYRKVHT